MSTAINNLRHCAQTVADSLVFSCPIMKLSLIHCRVPWRNRNLVLGLNDWWFESRQELGIFLFTTASRLALGPNQPPIQWVPGAISLGVRRPRRESDHSPPSSAEVKNAWKYTSALPIRLHGVVLI
jgi:hypothetical protein